jgi:outer membrane protein assembly factor BamB
MRPAEVGGRLSALTVADSRVFVSSVDRHTLYALDAARGHTLWEFTARARMDALAMAVTSGRLFVAGPINRARTSPEAPTGKEAIVLRAPDPESGAIQAEYSLSALPVFDGLAAASGRLYLALQDGAVECFAPQRR